VTAGALGLLLAFMLYLTVGTTLLMNGWPFRAGLAAAVAALAPAVGQILFTDSDAPGFLILLPLMLLPALLLMAVGAGLAFWRRASRTGERRPGL
jgi:hypothetical protein